MREWLWIYSTINAPPPKKKGEICVWVSLGGFGSGREVTRDLLINGVSWCKEGVTGCKEGVTGCKEGVTGCKEGANGV